MPGPILSKILIGLRILFGLLFLAAAGFKLAGAPMMVEEFDTVGLGQWFRYFTAILELAGALLLIQPRTVLYGAGLLTCVSLGALVAQLGVLHKDPIHAVVFALILGWIAYSYRGKAAGLS